MEIPYDALREAVVNALCHRAWQQEASSIGIAIYDDRVEIENAGRFPATLSPQRLTAEVASANDNTSLPPNPDIANVMFIGGLIEHWGRGLSMMNNKCKMPDCLSLKINDNGYMVKVIFARPLAKDKRTVGEQLENSKTPVGHQLNTSRTPAKEQLGEVSIALVKLIEAIGDNWCSAKS